MGEVKRKFGLYVLKHSDQNKEVLKIITVLISATGHVVIAGICNYLFLLHVLYFTFPLPLQSISAGFGFLLVW